MVSKRLAIQYTKVIMLVFITITSIFPGLYSSLGTNILKIENNPISSGDPIEDSVLWNLLLGLPGKSPSMEPFSAELDNSGEKYIIIGTDAGLGIIDKDGNLLSSLITFGPVIDIDTTEDVSNDGMRDLIITVLDQDHPNIYCISSNNCSEIWRFNTNVLGFNSELLLPQNYTSYSWGSFVTNDTNNDGISEVVIASWYRLYCLNGLTGVQIWKNDEDIIDDIWEFERISDINMDSIDDIIVGTEDGEIMAISGIDGAKIWDFLLPKLTYTGYFNGVPTTKEITVSVADIKIIPDFVSSSDGISDILVASDDSYLYLLSGTSQDISDYERIIAKQKIYDNGIPNTTPIYSSFSNGLYNYIQRIFGKEGVTIFELPDINNDGKNEYSTLTCDIALDSNQDDLLYSVFNLTGTDSLGNLNNITELILQYSDYITASSPCVYEMNNEIRFYFIEPSEQIDWITGESRSSISYYTYNLLDTDITTLTEVNSYTEYSDPNYQYYNPYDTSNIQFSKYLSNVGEIFGDGIEYLFGFSESGTYFLFNPLTNEIEWIKYKETASGDLIEFFDINGDSVKDLIYTKDETFNPEWRGDDEYVLHDYGRVITKLLGIDAVTGNILWEYQNPSSDYKGILDLQQTSDIDGDSIDDFVGWIIPSSIPDRIEDYIAGMSQTKFDALGSQLKEELYRTLLANYTKVIAISGKTGLIIRNIPAFDAIYNFKRIASYSGTYDNPSSGSVSSGNFYNRINKQTPTSWLSGSIYTWANEWLIETLTHPLALNIESGWNTQGNFLDVWDADSSSLSFNYTNTSSSLLYGIPDYVNSDNIIESDDNYWSIDSVNDNTEKIDIEMYINQTLEVVDPIQSIIINYEGYISSQIDTIAIYAYNFNTEQWTSIISNDINVSASVKKSVTIPNVNDYTIDGAVRIKISAEDVTNYTLLIDQLNAEYQYITNNVTVSSELVNNQQQTLLDFTFQTDLSDEPTLGSMDYPLSQLERVSAIKLQTKLLVNTSASSYYNFTYEMYNFSSNSWVECNWTNGNTYWNEGSNSFTDLYGGYATDDRSGYDDFELDTSIKTDIMFVGTRGMHSGISDWDSYVEFDYENATTLSHFIDSTTKEIKVRINITNGNIASPFNLTVDTFGVETFYWGLYAPDFDNNYIFDYDDSFTPWKNTNILDIEICDFDIGRLNIDNFDDAILLIGSSFNTNDNFEYRMIDFKNNIGITKWGGLDTQYLSNDAELFYFNKFSTNGIVIFANFDGTKLLKRVSDMHWEDKLSRFENFDSGKTTIDFQWTYIPDFDIYTEIFMTAINSTNYGLVAYYKGFGYDQWGNYIDLVDKVVIMDPNSSIGLYNISKIDAIGILDINTDIPKYSLSSIDFNNDGILDHMALYPDESFEPWQSDNMEMQLKIFDGSSTDTLTTLSTKTISVYFDYWGNSNSNPYFDVFPVINIGDYDDDGIDDLGYGVQGIQNSEGGAAINIIKSSSSEITEKILEPFSSTSQFYRNKRTFFENLKSIGDINDDGISELYLSRTTYKGDYGQDEFNLQELFNPITGKIISRINIEISDSIKIDDLNGDDLNEFLFFSGDIVFCINSKFSLNIPDSTTELIGNKNKFLLDWDTKNSGYTYFEVVVNGVTYAITEDSKMDMSLSGGDKIIQVLMYDRSGIISYVETLVIRVNTSYTMLIVTIAVIIGLSVFVIIKKKSTKKNSRKIVINNGGGKNE